MREKEKNYKIHNLEKKGKKYYANNKKKSINT